MDIEQTPYPDQPVGGALSQSHEDEILTDRHLVARIDEKVVGQSLSFGHVVHPF